MTNKRARLNCIAHLLSMIPYKRPEAQAPENPAPESKKRLQRSAMHTQTFVPKKY